MNYILLILFLLILAGITYSDLKHLSVSVYLLLPLLAIALIRSMLANTSEPALMMALINFTVTTLVLLISVLILFALKRSVFNPVNVLIGSGDLVFIPVVCLSFSPVNYILFFILSLLTIILVRLFTRPGGRFIPLAGMLSLMLGMVMIIAEFISFDTFSDQPVLNLIL